MNTAQFLKKTILSLPLFNRLAIFFISVIIASALLLNLNSLKAQAADCTTSLQTLINTAASGSTITLPACVFRESVTVNKPLTIIGVPGTEIRGADVWTTWTQSGNTWKSTSSLPSFGTPGPCITNNPQCGWPEQVFRDGVQLKQVATGTTPTTGQFALDSTRKVVLGDNPSGHIIEVTTRTGWMTVTANNVTIDSIKMDGASNAPQALYAGLKTSAGVSNFTLKNSTLSDAHGALLGVVNGTATTVTNNDLTRGGQSGFNINGSGAIFTQNKIHNNNTEKFDNTDWEAGGGKAVGSSITFDSNEVYDNRGPGIWIDIHSRNIIISNNLVHDNDAEGIFFEISRDGKIFNNKVWNNGWVTRTVWAWGSGIISSSAGGVEIYNNIVAWNADGISAISQNRGDAEQPTNISIHDNVIVQQRDPSDTSDIFPIGWNSENPLMYSPSASNSGSNNKYWLSYAEPSYCRFQWNGCPTTLAAYNATPGEENGVYISDAQRDSILASAGMPSCQHCSAPVPTPTPTPTLMPTPVTDTPTPTPTPQDTPTPTPTDVPPTPTPTIDPNATPTPTPTPTDIPTPTPTDTPTPTPLPTNTPTPTPIPVTYTINGNVFVDTNKNGAKDTGETNVNNAAINLAGVSLGSTSTDAAGNYTFTGRTAGNYNVTLTVPSGYTTTTANPKAITLGPDTIVNFGIALAPTPTPTRTPTPTPTRTPTPTPTPTPAPAGNGLSGAYFSNRNLTGSALKTRTDPTINFNWAQNTAPISGIGTDNYSVRWTGFVRPQYSQTYTFYANADDGIRVWVNNVLLIDQWHSWGQQEYSKTISLNANQKYAIKVEYYEQGGSAFVNLKWSSSSTPKAVVPQNRLYTN